MKKPNQKGVNITVDWDVDVFDEQDNDLAHLFTDEIGRDSLGMGSLATDMAVYSLYELEVKIIQQEHFLTNNPPNEMNSQKRIDRCKVEHLELYTKLKKKLGDKKFQRLYDETFEEENANAKANIAQGSERMKELFHKKAERPEKRARNNDHNLSEGILVLEAEPQMRRMFFHRNSANNFYIPLPKMIFIVRYFVNSDGRFIYPGIFAKGLHVYATKRSVVSLNSLVYQMPTDIGRLGLVCTDHNHDNSVHDSLEGVINVAVGGWYGLTHELPQQNKRYFAESFFFDECWTKIKSLAEFKAKAKWGKSFSLKTVMESASKRFPLGGRSKYPRKIGWPEKVKFNRGSTNEET